MSDKEFNHSQEIADRTNRIFVLIQDINRKTPFCMFFSFSGHTNQFDIHMGKSKEQYGEDVSNRRTIYLGYGDEAIEKLDKLETTLSGILKEHGVKEPSFEL